MMATDTDSIPVSLYVHSHPWGVTNDQSVHPCLQKVLDQFGKQFTWDLKAKQMGKKSLVSAQVSQHKHCLACTSKC